MHPGMLFEVAREHMVFDAGGDMTWLEMGELVLVIELFNQIQALALRLVNQRLVHIVVYEYDGMHPIYVNAL